MSSESKLEVLMRLNKVAEQLNTQLLEVQSVVASIRSQLTHEMFDMTAQNMRAGINENSTASIHMPLSSIAPISNTIEIINVPPTSVEPTQNTSSQVEPVVTSSETAENPGVVDPQVAAPPEPWLNARQLRRKLRHEAALQLQLLQQKEISNEPEPMLLGDPIINVEQALVQTEIEPILLVAPIAETEEPLLLTELVPLELGDPIAHK